MNRAWSAILLAASIFGAAGSITWVWVFLTMYAKGYVYLMEPDVPLRIFETALAAAGIVVSIVAAVKVLVEDFL